MIVTSIEACCHAEPVLDVALTLTGEIDSHLKVILTKEYLGKRAIYFGLDAYMEASVRQKDLLAAPSTLRYVAVGVLAAVYLDTGRDLASVVPVARRLG